MCWSLVLELINKYVLYIEHCSPNVKTTKICASEVIQSSFPCLVFSRIYLSVKMAPSKPLHSVPVAMDITCFVVPLILPVLDFWRCLPWISKPGWIPYLHPSSPACNGFLKFTSDATPADLSTKISHMLVSNKKIQFRSHQNDSCA